MTRARSSSILLTLALAGCGDCYSNANAGSCVDVPGTISGSCEDIREQAEVILVRECEKCHGADPGSGGFSSVLNVPRMIEKELLRPGDAANSRLFLRVQDDEMPDSAPALGQADKDTLRAWIDTCDGTSEETNPDFQEAVDNPFVDLGALFEAVRVDLNDLDPIERRNVRYISLLHLYNANYTESEIAIRVFGLSKLLNSLSWAPQVASPVDIGGGSLPGGVVFRIDIRDYQWQARPETCSDQSGDGQVCDPVDAWEYVLSGYHYGFTFPGDTFPAYEEIREGTGSRIPIVNGDWLVRHAGVNAVYHEVLDLPETQDAFLRLFGVSQFGNIGALRVDRAGFELSGVSEANRLMERHEATTGYCWVSYDFLPGGGDKDLFDRPLAGFDDSRVQADMAVLGFDVEDVEEMAAASPAYDGGEAFCSLPNGLQAYFLAKANGDRLNAGPTNVVSHDGASKSNIEGDRSVLNGMSCIYCHYNGIIPKGDELLDEAIGDPATFGGSAVVGRLVGLLHPPQSGEGGDADCPSSSMCGIQAVDEEYFVAAMAQASIPAVRVDEDDTQSGTGVRVDATADSEPVNVVARDFNDRVYAGRFAAEMGVDPDTFDASELPEAVFGGLARDLASGDGAPRDDVLALARTALCFFHDPDRFGTDGSGCEDADACGTSGVACLTAESGHAQTCADKEHLLVTPSVSGSGALSFEEVEVPLGVCAPDETRRSEVCDDRFDNDHDGTVDEVASEDADGVGCVSL